jgi:hypothetical protein
MDNKDKEITIIVNAREVIWSKKEISYQEVVEIAFGSYSDNPLITYTVSYSRGDEDKKEGTLVKGASVKVKKGMIFNVTKTDRS